MQYSDLLELINDFLRDNANFQVYAVRHGFTYEDIMRAARKSSKASDLLNGFIGSPQGLPILMEQEGDTLGIYDRFMSDVKGIFRDKSRRMPEDVILLLSTFLFDNQNFQIFAVEHGWTYRDLCDVDLPDELRDFFLKGLFVSAHGLHFLHKADIERARWDKALRRRWEGEQTQKEQIRRMREEPY